MIGADMIAKLDALHAAGNFYGLTIWPTKNGYQVNLATSAPNSWRIRRADTPSEGLALVLAMDFMDEDRPRASAELLGEAEMLAPPDIDEPPLPDEAHDEAGIFD